MNQEENPNGSLASIVVSPGLFLDTPACHQPQMCTVNPDVTIWPSDQRAYFTDCDFNSPFTLRFRNYWSSFLGDCPRGF